MKNFNEYFLNEGYKEEMEKADQQISVLKKQLKNLERKKLDLLQKINDEESASSPIVKVDPKIDPYGEEDWGQNRKKYYVVRIEMTMCLTIPSNIGWPEKFYLVDKNLKITKDYITNDRTGDILPIGEWDKRNIIENRTKIEVSGGWNEKEWTFGNELTLQELNLTEKEVGFYQPKMEI